MSKSDDLISRQDAIDAWDKLSKRGRTEFDQVLMTLPSTEPPYQYSEAYVNQLRGERDFLQDMVDTMAERLAEPKTGEWMLEEQKSQNHIEKIYICSSCRNFEAWGETELYNYCPNCGAKMEWKG